MPVGPTLGAMSTRTAGRGRPRSFDEDVALDQALDLFWERGYRATTTRDLEATLQVRQSSLYNAFGSKQALLIRAIDRYESRVEVELLSLLEAAPDGHDAVHAFFTELADWVTRNEHRGCLVVNLMTAEVDDPAIEDRVRTYRAKIRAAFASALSRTGADDATITKRADLLLASVLGLHITARTAAGTDEVPDMLAGICHQIDAWRAA